MRNIQCLSFIAACLIPTGTVRYHVQFVPKRYRRTIVRQMCRQLGQIFDSLALQKACQVLEGYLRPDHVHTWIAISSEPPRSLRCAGFSSEECDFDCHLWGRKRNFSGHHFLSWGLRLCCFDGRGFELEQVCQYLSKQESANCTSRQF